MIAVAPVTLEGHGVRLEPLDSNTRPAWRRPRATVNCGSFGLRRYPKPADTRGYIDAALEGQRAGHMLPWAVREARHQHHCRAARVITTSCPPPTASRSATPGTRSVGSEPTSTPPASCCCWRTHSIPSACRVVGLRTDNFNFKSQRAIEALGAKKDGVIRHHHPRRDGTVRDTVIYSILAAEWPDVKRHLELRLARHGA